MTLNSDFSEWINKDYYEWLISKICGNRFHDEASFTKLLAYLYSIPFKWTIKKDYNREEDGLSLRYRYCLLHDHMDELHYLNAPCSILEMMIALSIRCEEEYMSDTRLGDRTSQWFWNMIISLGLGSQMDYNFNKEYVEKTVNTFLNRKYKRNGKGGLFTVRNCKYDLRKVEIWRQMSWYLDNLD